jgi:hypothetical protein
MQYSRYFASRSPTEKPTVQIVRLGKIGDYTYSQDKILQRNLRLDPLFIRQRRPDEVWLGDRVFIWPEYDFRLLIIDVKAT